MTSCSFKKFGEKSLFRVLENRDFLLLWSGEIISQFGDRLAQIALVGIYLAHTRGMSVGRSVPLMSSLFFFSTLPVLIFGPFAGFFVDRWSRRNTLMMADFVRAGLVLVVPLFQLELKSIYYIYAVIFAVFAATCFFNPAKLAFIPALVPQERLLAANSLSNITRIIAMIGGVVAGGFVVARIGVRGSFILDALSFAFSGLLVANIKVKGNPASENIKSSSVGKVGKQIQEGFKFIWKRKQIFLISLTLFILMGAAGIGYVIVTVLVTKGLGLGTEGLSFAAGSLGAGMIAGSLIYGEFGEKLNRYFVVMVGSFLAGLCSLVLAEAQEIRLIL
ncbi:MFS transporter, partial [Candidatus Aerophobetes bacterium]|nr:MFS transporter [Candidatus Aerophobetes bacterium]